MTKTTIALKIFIAVVALAFSLCSACGFYFSLRMSEIWLFAASCFLVCGAGAVPLWIWLFKLGHETMKEDAVAAPEEDGCQ